MAVAEAAFGSPLTDPPFHSRAPRWPAVVLHGWWPRSHTRILQAEQLDSVADQVPVLELNCPSAPSVSRCIAVALAVFISIIAPFIIAKSSSGHIPDF